MVKIALVVLASLLTGCAAINSTLHFSRVNPDSDKKITGTAKVRFQKVQSFRSMLESLEYRDTEKAK